MSSKNGKKNGKKKAAKPSKSVFAELGLKMTISTLIDEVQQLYLGDEIPWVVGYSGGKDSTAVLQLVWLALKALPEGVAVKPVHVISTDTLVENPIVARWVAKSLDKIGEAAVEQGLPIEPHRLTPRLEDSFWVNLIGKGYPAPRPKFRWCTERLKINPSNTFISDTVRENGEAILVLGTRKAESSGRAGRMKKLEKQRVRERLSPNASLPNSLVYSPIEDWQNDDVWLFLMQQKNPWGYRNKDLLTMYQGASEDGECPLVMDSTTPSCGSSRFGCWVCTLVDKDRSMNAMIHNDEEKEWMAPMMELRDELDLQDDRGLRDFRRLTGHVQLFNDKPIHGPYKQHARSMWLGRLLEVQSWIQKNGPDYVRDLELVTLHELKEIRRIWVIDKHESEDLLPKIYEQQMEEPYPGPPLDESSGFGEAELDLLKDACGDDRLQYELLRELLDVENRYRTAVKRAGLFEALEDAFRRSGYEGMEHATKIALERQKVLKAAKERDREQMRLVTDQVGGARPS